MDRDPGLFATMYTARALRRFKPDPVPEDVVFQLFDAAIRAPSGQNSQDWRFLVVTDKDTRAKLGEWAGQAWQGYASRVAGNPSALDSLPRTVRLSMKSVGHLAAHVAETPLLVLVCGLSGRHSTPGGSTFPAVQNLLLAARAFGLGGSVFNLPLGHPDELRSLLGIPENNQVYCLLAIGYPTDKHGPLRRKPVKDVVYMGKWGEHWPFAEQQPENGWHDRWVPAPETTGP